MVNYDASLSSEPIYNSKYNITYQRIEIKIWWSKWELMTCFFGNGCPVANSMRGYVSQYLHILFCSPKTPFHIGFVTARRPPHCEISLPQSQEWSTIENTKNLIKHSLKTQIANGFYYMMRKDVIWWWYCKPCIHSGSEVESQGRRRRFKRMMSEEARKAWEMFPFNYHGMINIIFLQTVWGAI